jgi:hypothetical protein
MEFYCTRCKYKTNDRSHYNRHIKTRKHIDLEDIEKLQYNYNSDINKYICECGAEFSHRSSLSRHKNNKCDTNSTNQNSDFCLQIENKLLKQLVNKYENLNNQLLEYVKSNKIINNTYNISVKNYVQQNYPDAPPLEELTTYETIKYEDDDFIDTLVYNYNGNSLHKYLGNFIIKYYKKDNPAEQSMWSSDTSRLTYIIKELLSNNKSIWNHDYKGVKTKNYIITPLLEYIKEYIDEYWINHLDNYKTMSLDELNKFNNIYKSIYKIKKDIELDIIGNDIVRYIAPYFYMDKKDVCNEFIDDHI